MTTRAPGRTAAVDNHRTTRSPFASPGGTPVTAARTSAQALPPDGPPCWNVMAFPPRCYASAGGGPRLGAENVMCAARPVATRDNLDGLACAAVGGGRRLA